MSREETGLQQLTKNGRACWKLDGDCPSCGDAEIATDGESVRCLNCKWQGGDPEVNDG